MFSWNRLRPGIKAIFFVQIVNRMGDFVVPFLTLILTQAEGFTPAAAGLVVTLATALGSLGGLVAGKLSDRHGRRDTLVIFLGTSGLLVAGAGFAPTSVAAAAAMVASGFFLGAMRPVLAALVGDLSEPSTRRAAFSLSYLGINIGVSVGPLLAGWLFHHALNWMFWLDALSTATALAVLIVYVPRNRPPTQASGSKILGSPTKKKASSLSAFIRHPVLFPFALLNMAYCFCYSQMIFTQSLQLVRLFGTQGPQAYGTVWAVNAVTVIVLSPLVLQFTRNRTNLGSMAGALALFAAGASVFLFNPGIAVVLGATIVWSGGEILFSTHNGDFVTGQSPAELRGRFQGYVVFFGSLGTLGGPVVSGLVTQVWDLAGVWGVTTILAASVGIGFVILGKSVSRQRSEAATTP